LKTIPCQAAHLIEKDGSFGCYSCGGYGIVLQQSALVCCGRTYWHRPNGGVTVYPGKPWTSFDGVDTRWTSQGTVCAEHYVEVEDGPA
jgi:hypothetical protein